MPEPDIDVNAMIASELYGILERMGADSELLGVIGSWADTQSDEWVLEQLTRINKLAEGLE